LTPDPTPCAEVETARTLAAAGRLDEAAGLYRDLVARDPLNLAALVGLAAAQRDSAVSRRPRLRVSPPCGYRPPTPPL
jgi:hypothetical protein